MSPRTHLTGSDGGGPEGVPEDIARLAAAADRLFAAMRRARTVEADRGAVTLAQADLLEALLRETAVPVSHLAVAAGVSHPTATRMLKQLEAKDVVRRRRSTEDERVVLVALTAAGRRRLLEVRGRIRENQLRTLGRLSPAERESMTRHLGVLTDLITGVTAPR